jgi:hypothetical protein
MIPSIQKGKSPPKKSKPLESSLQLEPHGGGGDGEGGGEMFDSGAPPGQMVNRAAAVIVESVRQSSVLHAAM